MFWFHKNIIEKVYCLGALSNRGKIYFKGAEEIPAIIKALNNAVSEMRMFGLDHNNLDEASFIVRNKGNLHCVLACFLPASLPS